MISLRRFLTSKGLLFSVGAFLLYSLLGFVVLPLAITWGLPKVAHDSLNCLARLGTVRLNPFRMTCEGGDFNLLGPDGQPLASFVKAFADLDPSALVHRTACLRELRLDGASLHLVIEADGRINLAALSQPSPSPSPPPTAEPTLRLLLQHLVLADGTISLTDKRQSEAPTLTLAELDLQLNGLSSAGGETGSYYLATTTAEGETIEAQGELGLVPLHSSGRLVAGHWRLSTPWAFVRDAIKLAAPAGTLALSANYRFDAGDHPLQLAIADGRVNLSGVSLSPMQAERPLLELKGVSLEGVRGELASQSLSVKEILAEGGYLRMSIDEEGGSSFESMFAPSQHAQQAKQADTTQAQPSTGSQGPWSLELPSLAIKDIRLELEARHTVLPMTAGVASLSLGAGISAELGGQGTKVLLRQLEGELQGVQFGERGAVKPGVEVGRLLIEGGELDSAQRSLSLARLGIDDGRVDLQRDQQGQVPLVQLLTPRRAGPAAEENSDSPPWSIKASEVGIKDMAFAFEDLSLAKPLAATLSGLAFQAGLDMRTGVTSEVKLTDISSALNGLRLAAKGEQKAIFDAQRLVVEGGELDLGAHKLSLQAVGVSDGQLDIRRGGDGRWDFERLLTPRLKAPDPPAKVAKPDPGPAWSYVVKDFELKGFHSAFTDQQTKAKKPVYQMDKINLRARDIDGHSPIGFELELAEAQGGALDLRGTVDPGRPAVEAKVKVDQWRLAPLQPYLEPYLTVALSSGVLSSEGRLRYGLPQAGAKLAYDGEVRLDRLRLQEAGNKETLLGWRALAVRGLSLATQPNRLRVKEVRLQGPEGKLIINQERTVNLTKMLKPQETPATQFPFTISKVVVEDGQLLFADLSLQPQFMAHIHGLKGRVSQLSSEQKSLAEIQLDGGVDQYGYVTVNGGLNVNDVSQAAEVNLAFDNLSLASITPYAGKFAGRTIKGGKLSSKLHYTITDGQMVGDNTLLIDNLELGEHVDSPDAINLPLDLAVALLQDRNGHIDIGLPVSGDLKDPQFGLGPLLWKAFSSLITKAVTAPFRMLGALFGGGGEQSIDAVAFAPGQSELLPPEKEKLKTLAELLAKRPQLKLGVQGGYQTSTDGLIFRQERLNRAVAVRGGEPIPPGEAAPLPDIDETTTRRALQSIFSERWGEAALAELDRDVKEGRVAPRQEGDLRLVRGKSGSQGGRFAKIVEGAKLYRLVPGAKSPEQWALMATEIYARLLEAEQLPEQELRRLADQRAAAVGQELQAAGGIANERIALHPPAEAADGVGGQVKLVLEAL